MIYLDRPFEKAKERHREAALAYWAGIVYLSVGTLFKIAVAFLSLLAR